MEEVHDEEYQKKLFTAAQALDENFKIEKKNERVASEMDELSKIYVFITVLLVRPFIF